MPNSPVTIPNGSQEQRISSRSSEVFALFLISLIILFLELATIRWFPAHVLFLTFFTNTMLLACFLGMSVGCWAANHRRRYLIWTPLLLVIAMVAAHTIEASSGSFAKYVDVGHQSSPEQVFFGTEYHTADLSHYAIPIEVICGFFFLAVALALIGPGQELGRALNRWSNRIHAYTLNILGSIAGILLFAACSWLELGPIWWFLLIAAGLICFYFVSPDRARPGKSFEWVALAALPLVVWLASFTPIENKLQNHSAAKHFWSPYYRIDFQPADLSLSVNGIYHQQMVSRSESFPAYALPHLLNRDAGRAPFADVLIIGAGSGNDVSRALQWGANHVDAVEIDPAIYRLGRDYHPDHPYQDPRVEIHLDDGRNFLRSTNRKYNLIVYALVDSLVLHSGYSNIRLETYLFTQQAFADVRRHLKSDGTFVIYNYFRQGWLLARLESGLEEVFGSHKPLVLTLPYRKTIEPEKPTFGDFTVFFAGETDALQAAFERQPEYLLRNDQPPGPNSPNGFLEPGLQQRVSWHDLLENKQQRVPWQQFGLATVVAPPNALRAATDDWPFFYLRKPMIPTLSLRGMAVMSALALALIFLFRPGSVQVQKHSKSLNVRIFFLGAGFMLVETKAVVILALLFGSTWVVNSVVFFAVLLTILLANIWTLKFKPVRMWPYYAGLFVTLVISTIVPLDFFLGMNRELQVFGSCLLVFAPVLFAGVIFAESFRRTAEPDRAFGFNIAGAMMGGLTEYSSMMLGFQYVVLVAILFYAFSALGWRRFAKQGVDGSSKLRFPFPT